MEPDVGNTSRCPMSTYGVQLVGGEGGGPSLCRDVRRYHVIPALLLVSLAGPLSAQRLPPRFAEFRAPPIPANTETQVAPDSMKESHVGRMMLAGMGAGVLGAGVGAAVGALAGTGRLCGDDRCSVVWGTYGFAVGEALGIPLGVHLAGGRRGMYVLEAVTSLATAGAIALAFHVTPATAVVIPVSQILVSVILESDVRK